MVDSKLRKEAALWREYKIKQAGLSSALKFLKPGPAKKLMDFPSWLVPTAGATGLAGLTALFLKQKKEQPDSLGS